MSTFVWYKIQMIYIQYKNFAIICVFLEDKGPLTGPQRSSDLNPMEHLHIWFSGCVCVQPSVADIHHSHQIIWDPFIPNTLPHVTSHTGGLFCASKFRIDMSHLLQELWFGLQGCKNENCTSFCTFEFTLVCLYYSTFNSVFVSSQTVLLFLCGHA